MDGYPNVKAYDEKRLIIEDDIVPRFIAPTYFPAILGYAHEVHKYTLTEFGAWCSLFDLRRGDKPELSEEELAGIEFQPKIINEAKEYLNNIGIKAIVATPEDLCKARGVPYRETDNHCYAWSDDRKWFGGRWDAIAINNKLIIIEAKLHRYMKDSCCLISMIFSFHNILCIKQNVVRGSWTLLRTM